MKNKTKIKNFIPLTRFSLGFYFGLFMAVALPIIGVSFIKASRAYFDPLLTPIVRHFKTVEQVMVEPELTDEVYMANALKNAGLNVSEAFTVVWSESRGDENAQHINTNGTIDNGPWQINSIHIESGAISLQCAADLECATDWSINKRLHDGNWSAWYGARSLGIN